MASSSASTTTTTARPKFDWYETDQQIVLSVLVKNMKPEAVSVQFAARSMVFKYTPESGEPVELNLNLNSSISPAESTFRVSPVKAELKMRKVANFRWGKLEATEEAAPADAPKAFVPMASVSGDLATKASTAITSAQQKLRKWDEQVKEVEKEEEENGGVEQLFRKIYSSSDENVRKAMMKSFQESNGTVLSTNWDEVKAGHVDMKPPESSEFKKW